MIAAVLACALMTTLWGVAALVVWKRRATMWVAPAWIAATASGAAMAIGTSDLDVMSALRGMVMTETGSPSIAAVAAWIFEALRPAPLVLFFAVALQLVTIVLLDRIRRREKEGGRGGARAVIVTSVLIGALALTIVLHQRAIAMLDEGFLHRAVPKITNLEEYSKSLDHHWKSSVAAGTLVVIASVITAIVFMSTARAQPPSRKASRALMLLAILACLVTLVGGVWIWRTADPFAQVAQSGELLP